MNKSDDSLNRNRLPVHYGIVMRNAGLNLGGKILPAIVAVLAIPYIIRGLGLEQYGILSLALVVVTYFSLFDFGLGAAATKFVAGALGRGEEEHLPALIWTTMAMISALGLAAGIAMYYGSPFLAQDVLKISPNFRAEAGATFQVMAIATPFMLTATGWRGVLEARQRYDLVNIVSIPSGIATYAIPALALFLHAGLVTIVGYLVIARAVNCLAYFLFCQKVYPNLLRGFRLSFRGLRPVLVFGGWLAISNLAWPILLYMDRLVIGALLPVRILPFYAAPCDVVTRLWILPASWIALYPAFSAVGENRLDELANLSARGLKHLAMLMGPIVILAVFFAPEILRLWLGQQFALKSTTVFRVLTIGVFVNSLASVPDLLIKGLGRSDIVAKLHVAELPLYAGLLYYTVKEWGIVGASFAWAARALVEAIIVFVISRRLVPPISSAIFSAGMVRVCLTLSALAGAMWLATSFFSGVMLIVWGVALLLVMGAATWRCVLDNHDREFLRSALSPTA